MKAEANNDRCWTLTDPGGNQYGPYTLQEVEHYLGEGRVGLDWQASAGEAPCSVREALMPHIRGWNWGAFFLCGIWLLFNRAWRQLLYYICIGLLFSVGCGLDSLGGWGTTVGEVLIVASLIGVLAFQIVAGWKGNEWAWRSGKFKNVEAFKGTQRGWALAGWILVALRVLSALHRLLASLVGAGAAT